jgi:O-antigen ligase
VAIADPEEETSRLDRVRLFVVAAAVALCATLFSAHLTSFLHAKEAVLALFTCVLGLLTMLRGRVSHSGVAFLLPLLVVPALCMVAGALGLTTLRLASAAEFLRWVALAAFILCVFDLLETEPNRRWLRDAIAGSAALAGLLAILQFMGVVPYLFPEYNGNAHAMYSVFGNPGLLGGYLAAGLPLALYEMSTARKAYVLRLLACVVIIAALALSGTRSAWIAAAAGTAFAVLHGRLWNRRALAGSGILALTLLGVVFLAPEFTTGRMQNALHGADPSMGLRYWFWAGTMEMIRDHVWFGVGPGNFGYFSPLALADVLHHVGGERFVHNEIYTDHAHNDLLELTAELGVIGILPIVWWWVYSCRRPGPEWGALISLLVFSCFYFPFYSMPHCLIGLLLAGMVYARARDADSHTPQQSAAQRSSAALVGLCAVFVLPLVVWMVVLPSFRLRAAMDLHVAGLDPIPAYERTLETAWAPIETYEKLGLALLQSGDSARAEREFLAALDGMDTGAVYLGLGAARLQLGKQTEAREAFEACVYRWPSHAAAWEMLLRVTPEGERADVLRRAERWLDADEISVLRPEPDVAH